ncbi:MAG: glycosyltransferase [Succinivibrio sp.]|nr:glycosyltransferase [Succinivibrio sp.]
MSAKKTTGSKPELLPEICTTFADKFKQVNGVMCFMLDVLPLNVSAGLELSSFRRAGLFKRYFGIDTWLLTDFYQPHSLTYAINQIRLGRMDNVRLINLYDYLQDINRGRHEKVQAKLKINSAWKVRPFREGSPSQLVLDPAGNALMYLNRSPDGTLEFVNYIRNNTITQRDTYDSLGFISKTEFIDQPGNFTRAALYFRPDHTIALSETFSRPPKEGDKPVVETINIYDRSGYTIQRFTFHDELVAYWLLLLLNDPNSTYFVIVDQIMEYQRFLIEVKRQRKHYSNIITMGVSHNCHVVDPQDPLNSQLGDNYRFLFDQRQQVDRVITLTQRQKDDVAARFKENANPATVIPHHFTAPQPLKKGENAEGALPEHAVIHVGRFNASKGQDLALDSFKLVLEQYPEATLHFYGSGPEEAVIKKRVEEEGLADSVFFHGFVPDLRQVYATAALMICTSRHEGWSLVIEEALAAGCPVVSFDCNYGPAAMIDEGKNGYLVPPLDITALAGRVVEILKDPKLRAKFSKAAVQSVKRFAPEQIATQWGELLNELLDNNLKEREALKQPASGS